MIRLPNVTIFFVCLSTWHIFRTFLEKTRIKFYGRLLYFVIWFKLTQFEKYK